MVAINKTKMMPCIILSVVEGQTKKLKTNQNHYTGACPEHSLGDSEIGLYYLRNRDYYPDIYRFTSRDPVQGKFIKPLSLHKYLYCINSPTLFVDPDGREIRLGYADVYDTKYYHSLIQIIPENQAKYYIAGNLEFVDRTGQINFIIDAGPEDPIFFNFSTLKARLQSASENDHLSDALYDYCIINLDGRDEDDVIHSLLYAYSNYVINTEYGGAAVNYDLFPNPRSSDGYNSNSFTSGLLRAVDIDVQPPDKIELPGWPKPVRRNLFTDYDD